MPPAASSPYFPSGYGGMPSFYMPELSSMPIGPSHSMDFMSEQFQGHYLCHVNVILSCVKACQIFSIRYSLV